MFPDQTGLPVTIYISQQQDNRPASVEVSQYYGRHHSLSDIFTLTVPRTENESPRIIGDTGSISVQHIAVVCKYVMKNRQLLLDVWDHGDDETWSEVWCYYTHLKPMHGL